MRCPTCGRENRPDARFCGGCGGSLAAERPCPACGAPNPSDNRFCDRCGHELTAPAAPAAPEPSPLAYTPDHLAEKILRARSSLEGERKQVTVLFADVMGSMDLAEQVDAEAWRSIMERFFAILCEGVHRFEGTIDKFTGDGIMALFGAPIAHEDHAARACYAALHLHEQIAGYAAELRRERGLSFSMRIGINSGDVVVGTIGDDLSLEYTALGHTVGLAQRMEALAEPGTSYLTQSTAALVAGFLELRDLGQFSVKGARDPVGVFELTGVGPVRSRLEVSRRRGFSRFVGRDDELAELEEALERARGGEGQVVGVVGEAGVGKSRLCHELVERARARGIPVYHAAATAHGKHVPFLAALEMVRGYFGVGEQDDDQTARERIAGRLLLLDAAFADDLPLLFDFLGVADPERPAPRMDPEARQRQLVDVIKRLVHAQSRREPAINLLEDLHWIDPGSEVFLEALIDALPDTRSLTVVNFRPEYHAAWMARSHYRHLVLVPLGAEASEDMLRHLLGDDPSLEDLLEEIRRRTGGNPFFIEEVVRSLDEDGSLSGERGAYRLARPMHALSVPPTVHAVLAARIDRLADREKALVQTAAVIGREFDGRVLERVAQLSPSEIAAALRALTAADFIYQQALYPEPEYAFRHPLTQEVAYRSQLGERRAGAHAAVAQAVADLYGDSLDERAGLLAHHWQAAGEPREAARWSARAAAWAGISDPAEAVRHWRRVRDLVAGLPEDPETTALGLTARLWILQFGWRLGISRDDARAVFDEGHALAERHGDKASLALLLATDAGLVGVDGDMVHAFEKIERADRLAADVGAPALRLAVGPFLCYALFHLGRVREALAAAEERIALTRDDASMGAGIAVACPLAWYHMARGFSLVNVGTAAETRQALELAVDLARRHGDLETEGWARLQYVTLGDVTGEHDGVLAEGQRALEIAERIGDAFSRTWAQAYCGFAHAVAGDPDVAVELLEQSIALSRERRSGLEGEAFKLALLGRARLARGEPARAVDDARAGLAFATERSLLTSASYAAGAAGEALLACGREQEAAQMLRETASRSRSLGFRPLEARAHAGLAEVARRGGDAATAARELGAARALFEEIGAPVRARELEDLAPTA